MSSFIKKASSLFRRSSRSSIRSVDDRANILTRNSSEDIGMAVALGSAHDNANIDTKKEEEEKEVVDETSTKVSLISTQRASTQVSSSV